MLHDVVGDPAAQTEAEVLAAHAAALADVIDAVGTERAVEAADLPASTVTAVADGDPEAVGDLDLEAAAAMLALADGSPAARDIVAEAREALLLGMTTGVLSVDDVAGEAAVAFEPREVQGMIEGRHPMTVRQYVTLHRIIASRGP